MSLYLVCFDLSKSLNDQNKQIAYWLDFLNSSLPLPPSGSQSNWGIIIVGVRADQQNPSPDEQLQPHHIRAWSKQWPRLRILNKRPFAVSSTTSEESVRDLLSTIEEVCDAIFAAHATQIPSLFRTTLASIKSHPIPSEISLTSEDVLYAEHGNGVDKDIFSIMLQYFNSIGHILCLNGGAVCIESQVIPKLAAMFVSPEDVRRMLLQGDKQDVQILAEKDVGCLLDITNSDDERYYLPITYIYISVRY